MLTSARQYWLMKSEPFKYSWQNLQRDGHTLWDGVRNYAARNNLQAMQVGDEAFFYHSNEGKACVGVMRISQTAHPDPTATADELTRNGENPWVVVKVEPVRALSRPVTLAMIRAEPRLHAMVLLHSQRLSVQPVTAAEWQVIIGLAEAA